MKHTKIIPFFKALKVEIDEGEEDVINSVVKFATRNFYSYIINIGQETIENLIGALDGSIISLGYF
jgi:hypothetical protein